MISTISLTLDLNSKTGRVTDTTDYSGLIASLSLYQAKGLGTISFQGNIIESFTTTSDPLIDLAVGDTFFEFPLELDVNGEIANGIYEVNYSLRLSNAALGPVIVGVTGPSEIEVIMPQMISNFLEVGNTINLAKVGGDQDVTISNINYVDPTQSFITFNEVIDDPAYTFWYFDIINLQVEGVYTYAGCVRAEGRITFSYDCDVAPNGTFGVSNATILPAGQTVSTVNANISYPSWTSSQVGFISQISNAPIPYTNNVLATGTYTVVMNQIIELVQNDGLIITYPVSTTGEFKVSCVGSLCGLNSCIDSLRIAHAAELQRNKISKYQVFVDNVLMYYAEAQTYRACGDADAYRTALANIQTQLDASGCDCGCCDDEVYTWVSVNSSATIESLIEAIQYRLKNGVPGANDDENAGVQFGAIWQNTITGILYRCVDNSPLNAQWDVYYDPSAPLPSFDANSITYAGAALYPGPTFVGPALDIASSTIIGQEAEITAIQGDIITLQSDVAGKLTANSPIVGGVATKISYDTNGLVVAGTTLSATDIPFGVDAQRISTGLISNTEFGYLNGVSSNIQTQLNNKFPLNLSANTTLGYNNFILTLSTGTAQTDITKAQSPASSAPALTVQSRNPAATTGFGSSIQLSANVTGNSTQVPLSTIRGSWTDAANGDSKLSLSTTKGETESVQLEISNEGQIKLNQYNAGNFPDPAPEYLLGVDAAGNVVQAPAIAAGPGVLAGVFVGNGASASLTQMYNTTGETFTLTYNSTGQWTITASGSIFSSSKTIVFSQAGNYGVYQFSVISNSTQILFLNNNFNTGTPADFVDGVMIKIEVYP